MTDKKWETKTPSFVVLLQQLQKLHLRLTKIELIERLQRANAVLRAMRPRNE